MSTELSGALIALLVPLCFGSGMVLARIGLVDLPATTGNLISLVGGWVVIAVLAVALFPSDLLAVSVGTLVWLAMIGFVNFPIGRFLNFTSVRQLGILRANPILSAAPIVSAFEGVVFLGESINIAIASGTVITVVGVTIVVAGEVKARGPTRTVEAVVTDGKTGLLDRHPVLIGYLAAAGGAMAYGTIPALGRIAVTELATPLVTAVYTMLFGWLFMGLLVVRRLPGDLRAAPRRSTLLVAAGGVFMSTGVSLLYLALSKAPVVVVSPVFALNAFVSMVLVHIFLQRLERITPQIIIGTVLVVLGVVAVIVGTQI